MSNLDPAPEAIALKPDDAAAHLNLGILYEVYLKRPQQALGQYREYQHLGHIEGAAPWLTETAAWLAGRFAGLAAPQDCSEIAAGNSLAPIKKEKK